MLFFLPVLPYLVQIQLSPQPGHNTGVCMLDTMLAASSGHHPIAPLHLLGSAAKPL